jgi:hypothetical protein
MKRKLFLLAVILFFAGAGFNCRPNVELPPGFIKGKLVVNGPCGNYVVQVVEGDIDPSRLLKTWTDSVRDTTYTNVFRVANACDFGGARLLQNDIFQFKLNDTVIVQNCMLCMIFYPTPAVSNTVSHIQLVGTRM